MFQALMILNRVHFVREIFPSSDVFFSFFSDSVFVVEVLTLPLINLFLGILIFKAIVNGIVLLNSFSVYSLLAYKTASDFVSFFFA
jgi:hypothetical protein